jgi:hypothetical protein
MHGAIREYRLRPGTAEETIGKISEQFIPMIANVPGLRAYTLTAVRGSTIVTTSVFEDQAGAQESVRRAADWVNATLATSVVGPPRVTIGELPVRLVIGDVKAGCGVMRRFACTSANALLIAERVRKGLLPMLRATPGFASFGLLLADGEDRGGASLSAFADRATADVANERALLWVKENVGALLMKPPEVLVGEIRLRYARSTARSG